MKKVNKMLILYAIIVIIIGAGIWYHFFPTPTANTVGEAAFMVMLIATAGIFVIGVYNASKPFFKKLFKKKK